MDSSTAAFCDLEPLMADLAGGLSSFINLRPMLQQIQEKIDSKSNMKKSLFEEEQFENDDDSSGSPVTSPRRLLTPKARLQVERASLPEYEELQPLAARLHDMVDLERVVVIVGFGEVGKYSQRACFASLTSASTDALRSVWQQPDTVGSRVLRYFLDCWLRGAGLGHGSHQISFWHAQRQRLLRLA